VLNGGLAFRVRPPLVSWGVRVFQGRVVGVGVSVVAGTDFGLVALRVVVVGGVCSGCSGGGEGPALMGVGEAKGGEAGGSGEEGEVGGDA